jgi:hypothetical protein
MSSKASSLVTMTGKKLTPDNLRGPRRARAKSPVSRRGSRRGIFDLLTVYVDGEPVQMTNKRKRRLKRAADRTSESRAQRKARRTKERVQYLLAKANAPRGIVWMEPPSGKEESRYE